jgi:hypothetical protein
MQKIFLETADSYQGPAGAATWDAVLMKYYKDIKIDKLYSVIKRETDKVSVNHLKGYLYRNKNEDANKGCIVDGSTTAAALLACLAGCKETGPDVIYIISADSAHHFTYALSKNAFTKHGTANHRKVVVNFDNHRDYNAKKWVAPANTVDATTIYCGGWGAFHLGFWSNVGTGGSAYITMANGKDGTPNKYNEMYSVDQNGVAATITNPTDQQVIQYLGGANLDVYFSVDRDFMSGNGTKYGDAKCLKTVDNGIAFVKQFVDAAAGKIIGQDIIGLPTNRDVQGVVAEATLYAKAVANVNAYVALFV